MGNGNGVPEITVGKQGECKKRGHAEWPEKKNNQ